MQSQGLGLDYGLPLIVTEERSRSSPHPATRRERSSSQSRGDGEEARLTALLGDRPRVEQLLADLSGRFSSLPEDQVDGEIELWMRRLAEMLGADRSSFAELRPEGFVVTHTYAAPGFDPYPKGLANNRLPWLMNQFAAGREVILSRIPEDLPEDAVAERRYFTGVGMRSGVGIPVSVGGAIICVLTFGRFREPRDWPHEVISRLEIAGGAFGNAVARWRVKQRLDQQQAELAHIGRVAAMAELAAVIAHELDQPLTALVSNAEAVRMMLRMPQPDLADADDALIDVIDAAMRVSEIVRRERRLLRKSRESFETVDVNEAVHEIELFVRAEARRDGARVTFDLLPGLPAVHGDRVQLQQVFLNLARNALQAMRERPRDSRELSVRTASSTGEVTLTVTDSGPGIEESVLARMFEPFFTTKTDGLGMGLSISKSIVEAHHGRLWAARNAGNGLTVHVAIPRKREQP